MKMLSLYHILLIVDEDSLSKKKKDLLVQLLVLFSFNSKTCKHPLDKEYQSEVNILCEDLSPLASTISLRAKLGEWITFVAEDSSSDELNDIESIYIDISAKQGMRFGE
eukprot:gnl/Carplike_NY0171/2926_a3935_531.p2 GENE.gnl/Carplike_NY0171/2926_a3935_531~~gnl/Carplike_NY0171/2926_a3935_531.p2  ORF type:complete len:109 (+),score=20.63 gnl/Carplike_NY0171/2926_a3935_531:265-591(+)